MGPVSVARRFVGSWERKRSGSRSVCFSLERALRCDLLLFIHLPVCRFFGRAAALVTKAGLDDGRFLLRTRPEKQGEYVLCVVYKGRPTHHLVKKNEEGMYTVNKKTYGNHSKVTALVNQLSQKTAGWPVPLNKPVNREGVAAAAQAPTAIPAATGGGSYVHKGINREQAEALLSDAGLDDGRFLCRFGTRPGEFVLCVVYKGRPTHHLMKKGEDGIFLINKKSYGAFKKPAQLIKHLGKPGVKGWPIPLDKPVYVGGGSSSDGEAAKKAAAAAAAKAKAVEEATKEKEAEAEAAKGSEATAESTETTATTSETSPPQAATPVATEPTAVAMTPSPAQPALDPPPAQPAVDPAEALAAAAREAASAAHADVAQKKMELEALRAQALIPSTDQSFRLLGDHPGGVSSTDGPVTPALARTVIKMGQRLSELEMQTQQLNQIISSLIEHAQRISLA